MDAMMAAEQLYTDRIVSGIVKISADGIEDAARAVARARTAQSEWAQTPLDCRLRLLHTVRLRIASCAAELADAVVSSQLSRLNRQSSDTLVAEVLPLAAAAHFLERRAAEILKPALLGKRGRPLWLAGVHAEVYRVPLGVVLVIAPSNYPLFLPGVQALQALAAGNCVLWKPAPGGESAARALARMFTDAGVPAGAVQVLNSSAESAQAAIRAGVDKVFLTGHADTGRAVMRELAATLTPSVMELSGCDAVFILPGADVSRAAQALAFGMRLNGSATCMAPRRVFAHQDTLEKLIQSLLPVLEKIGPVRLAAGARANVESLLSDASRGGATIVRDGRELHGQSMCPTIVSGVRPTMAIMQTDVFAPLLCLCATADASQALAAHARCKYALTAAVFGPEKEALALAALIPAGTVLVNDLIVSTADPRVPFGGRGESGFGVTRGQEGLLEMTAVKVILRQKSKSLRPYAPTTKAHEPFFTGLIEAMYAGSMRERWRGLCRLVSSAQKLKSNL